MGFARHFRQSRIGPCQTGACRWPVPAVLIAITAAPEPLERGVEQIRGVLRAGDVDVLSLGSLHHLQCSAGQSVSCPPASAVRRRPPAADTTHPVPSSVGGKTCIAWVRSQSTLPRPRRLPCSAAIAWFSPWWNHDRLFRPRLAAPAAICRCCPIHARVAGFHLRCGDLPRHPPHLMRHTWHECGLPFDFAALWMAPIWVGSSPCGVHADGHRSSYRF